MNEHEQARSQARGTGLPARKRDRRWLKRLLLACLLILLVALLSWVGRAAWLIATAPARPFDIAHETTRIHGPLDEDGYPDYRAALNRLASERVAPECNAAVDYWAVVGPPEHRPPDAQRTMAAELARELGIDWAEEDDRLVPFGEYVQAKEEGAVPDWDPYEEAVRRPWSAKAAPQLAGWLDNHREALDRLVEAARKSGWYSPLLGRDSTTTLLEATMPDVDVRGPLQPLLIRAMRRLDEGDVEAAWRDIFAVRRLGRIVQQGPTLLHVAVGVEVETMAFAAETAFCEHGRYAEKLADLVPRYMDHVPCNVCTGNPPEYSRSSRGFRIATSGPGGLTVEMPVGPAD